MEKRDLAPIITEFSRLHRQLFEMMQTLALASMAAQEVMKDHGDASFQADLHQKIQTLTQGEFGQLLAQDRAAFEANLRRIMTNLIGESSASEADHVGEIWESPCGDIVP